MKPTDLIECERLHCRLTADACVRRQVARISVLGVPEHLPCGIYLALRDGCAVESRGNGHVAPCEQGIQVLVQLGTDYRLPRQPRRIRSDYAQQLAAVQRERLSTYHPREST